MTSSLDEQVSSLLGDDDLDLASLGGGAGRLLAGPRSIWAAETIVQHLMRLGQVLVPSRTPREVLDEIAASGLVGRGGGEFPFARKLATALAAGREPIVVVNASEGEPASRKDITLLRLRPHLVLDGAEAVAFAIRAGEVVVYTHATRGDLRQVLESAFEERRAHGVGTARFRLVESPSRYVAGESSAVVSFLERGVALPTRRALPAAANGVGGRPTIVSNTETYAHVGLIARHGAAWFREAGTKSTPGSTLVTLQGTVKSPGSVVEVLRPVPFNALLSGAGGLEGAPPAVLVGGYAGTWVDGAALWPTSIDRNSLRSAGVALGCGLIAPIDAATCGVAETTRILWWMAHESAGQCGPCANGLPAVADLMELLISGKAQSRDLLRLRQLAVAIRGRGDCGHPTGAIELLESALDTFHEEVRRHVRGKCCTATGVGFPLPESH